MAPTQTSPPCTDRIVVVAPNYWGRGATVELALAACKKAGGAQALRRYGYVAYQAPEGAIDVGINAMGTMVWYWANDARPPSTTDTVNVIVDKTKTRP